MQGHNWKTMLFGVLTILVSAGGAYAALKSGGIIDWPTVISTCLLGLGLVLHHTPPSASEPTDNDIAGKLTQLLPVISAALGPATVTRTAQASGLTSHILVHADGSVTIPATSTLQPDGTILHGDGSKTIPAGYVEPAPASTPAA